MKKVVFLVLLGFSSSACVAGRVALPMGAEAGDSSHPHGGPPGQQKKDGHTEHHRKCGHKNKKEGGVVLYLVDGNWVK